MKYSLSVFAVMLGSMLIGLGAPAFAENQDSSAARNWRWQQIEPLFPHAPGNRWVYALSGTQYANGGELQVEMKGKQHLPRLQQDALLVDESHPGLAPEAPPEVVPVLYYIRQGYLVRDTAYIYSNPQRTSLVFTGNLGEAVAPVLPLWPKVDGTDWQPGSVEHWGEASRLDIGYSFHPEKEAVTVKAGTYTDSVRVEGTVKHGDGSGYHYQEWYAPGVGLVKSTTTDLQSGDVLLQKELVSFHAGPDQ